MIRRDADAVPDVRLPGDEPKPVLMTGNVVVEFDVSFIVTIDKGHECTNEQAMLDTASKKCRDRLNEAMEGTAYMEYESKEGFPRLEE